MAIRVGGCQSPRVLTVEVDSLREIRAQAIDLSKKRTRTSKANAPAPRVVKKVDQVLELNDKAITDPAVLKALTQKKNSLH
jgi:hypothetical protein